MNPLTFVWDERKNAVNKQKHGISFEEAETVFYDENALLISDPEHSDGEDRFLLLARIIHKFSSRGAAMAVRSGLSQREAPEEYWQYFEDATSEDVPR